MINMTVLHTITGELRHITGELLPNTTFTIAPVVIVSGDGDDVGIMGDIVEITSDASAQVEFDLYEGDYVVEYMTTRGKVTRAARVDTEGPWTMGRFLTPTGTYSPSLVQQAAASAAQAETAADRAEAAADVFPVTPDQFGAQSGILLDPVTRTIYDAIIASSASVQAEYLWLLEKTVREFQRAGLIIGTDVTYSISGGVVTWADSGALTARLQKAYDYIELGYLIQVEGSHGRGATVTSTQLNAANAINPATNAAAMQDWLDAVAASGQVGVLGAADYPIGATLVIPSYARISGVRGRSRIRMASTVGYRHITAMTGKTDVHVTGVTIENGIIFDGNYLARVSAGAGTISDALINDDLWGTTLSIANTSHSSIDAEAWDAYKHCFDVSGNYHGRSGTPYTQPYVMQRSFAIKVPKIITRGSGDDLTTTHSSTDLHFGVVRSFFARGDLVSNGNGFEVDDGSIFVRADDVLAMFCYTACEIKGHADAQAAHDVHVSLLESVNATNGVVIRHIDHGAPAVISPPTAAEPQSTMAANVTIGRLIVRDPVAWLTSGAEVRAAARVYAYDNVTFGPITVEQGDAASDYFGVNTDDSDGVVQMFNSAGRVTFSTVAIDGFSDSATGFRVTSSTIGPVSAQAVITRSGPMRAVSHTNDDLACDVTIGIVDAHRSTATAGSYAVRGVAGKTRVGTIRHKNMDRVLMRAMPFVIEQPFTSTGGTPTTPLEALTIVSNEAQTTGVNLGAGDGARATFRHRYAGDGDFGEEVGSLGFERAVDTDTTRTVIGRIRASSDGTTANMRDVLSFDGATGYVSAPYAFEVGDATFGYSAMRRVRSAGREELVLVANRGSSFSTGSLGAAVKMYGNADAEHPGAMTLNTGTNDNVTARYYLTQSGTHVLGSGVWDYGDALNIGTWQGSSNYPDDTVETAFAHLQVKDNWTIGSGRLGVFVDQRAQSQANASTVPQIGIGVGWRELPAQDIGSGEGVGYGFYARLVGDTAHTLLASIVSEKVSATDLDRTSDLVTRLSEDGSASPREVQRISAATGIANFPLGATINGSEVISTASFADPRKTPGVPVVIARGTAAAVTGVTTEETVATFVLPAGFMGPFGRADIRLLTSQTNNANNKGVRVTFGGTTVMFSNAGFTGSLSTDRNVTVFNVNSEAVQAFLPAEAVFSPSETAASGASSAAVNTAADVTCTITVQLANAADSLQVVRWELVVTHVS
jgi:hypothetical protein